MARLQALFNQILFPSLSTCLLWKDMKYVFIQMQDYYYSRII